MLRRPPGSTRTATPFPDTSLFRSNPRTGAPVLRLVSVSGRNVAGGLPDPRPARVLCLLRSLLGRHVFPDRSLGAWRRWPVGPKILRLRSEEHTSELQSLMRISYAVFCLKKKKKRQTHIKNKTKRKISKY